MWNRVHVTPDGARLTAKLISFDPQIFILPFYALKHFFKKARSWRWCPTGSWKGFHGPSRFNQGRDQRPTHSRCTVRADADEEDRKIFNVSIWLQKGIWLLRLQWRGREEPKGRIQKISKTMWTGVVSINRENTSGSLIPTTLSIPEVGSPITPGFSLDFPGSIMSRKPLSWSPLRANIGFCTLDLSCPTPSVPAQFLANRRHAIHLSWLDGWKEQYFIISKYTHFYYPNVAKQQSLHC